MQYSLCVLVYLCNRQKRKIKNEAQVPQLSVELLDAIRMSATTDVNEKPRLYRVFKKTIALRIICSLFRFAEVPLLTKPG